MDETERKDTIALIGLGVVGTPIAYKLYLNSKRPFYLVAGPQRKQVMEKENLTVNGTPFKPAIISELNDEIKEINLLIICVKNYDLKSALADIKKVATRKTIFLPLQNGIYAYEFFRREFPDNVVLQGYVQGPNTERRGEVITYQNPGEIHIGSDKYFGVAQNIYSWLSECDIPVRLEANIRDMVWKKWMLNIAGNSVTALTGADYSLFKIYDDLQTVCIRAMEEFLQVAKAEDVNITEKAINDVINYYVSYSGNKKTSMLVDVLNESKTENDYLAGTLLKKAKKHNISLPVISTLFYLMEIKEDVYMEKKGCRTMTNLFTDAVEYSDALKFCLKDIDTKLQDKDYAQEVKKGSTKELQELLRYAADNTDFYSSLAGRAELELDDFPVMNKTLLNENYDSIRVPEYSKVKTHQMHTSGSTGIPFTVIQDLAKRERHIADLKYFGAMAGYADHDPMCYLRAKPTATPEAQERDNIWQLDICNLNEKNLTDYYHVMVEKECTALMAYPSTLETAVDFWSQHFTNDSCIKTIISTSETLTEEVKEKLKAFFGDDVGVFARYSNTENGILGQEIDESGIYRLNWASYFFEILKLDSDEPAPLGEIGRVIVTDLYNKAFPMIRYDTGDVAKMEIIEGELFPVISELYGRRMDLIYDTNGEVVSPFLLCRTMRLSRDVEQWQFIQESPTEYTIKITTDKKEKPDLSAEVESFKKTLGDDADIKVEYVESIPVMNSLKRKLIVSKL